MNTKQMSFPRSASFATAAVWLAPCHLFAEAESPVAVIRGSGDRQNFTFPPSPEGALPTKVFKTELKLHLNGTNYEQNEGGAD